MNTVDKLLLTIICFFQNKQQNLELIKQKNLIIMHN